MRALWAGAAAVLALAGCKDKQAAQVGAEPASEVLQGSVSDAMIAYDRLRSQPPLATDEPSDAASGAPGVRTTRRGTSAAASDEPAAEASVPASGEPATQSP